MVPDGLYGLVFVLDGNIEELLLDPKELELIYKLRRVLVDMNPVEAMELLTTRLKKVKSNGEFLMTMNLA